jgi:SAM-dependent methyltransferase
MAEAISERVSRYILDGSDDDLRRLLGIAQLLEGMARRAFLRAEVEEGWTAIECGCGPIGALAIMAEIVGPSGRVVGVDFGEPAVQRARSVLATLELENAQVFAGDVHDLDVGNLGGPFDLAYTRCFLMHQSDPAHTLARIAELVRPGGWIIVQEPLRSPAPHSHPPVEALGAYWELMHELEVVSVDGFFTIITGDLGFDLHGGTLAAMRDRAIQLGVASEQEIDELAGAIGAGRAAGAEWVSSPFFLDLALRKPM